MKVQNIDLSEKVYLNPQEAVTYWNLSNRKFRTFIRNGRYPFMALYGTRRLILRVEFERYLREHPNVKEKLANGEPNKKRF